VHVWATGAQLCRRMCASYRAFNASRARLFMPAVLCSCIHVVMRARACPYSCLCCCLGRFHCFRPAAATKRLIGVCLFCVLLLPTLPPAGALLRKPLVTRLVDALPRLDVASLAAHDWADISSELVKSDRSGTQLIGTSARFRQIRRQCVFAVPAGLPAWCTCRTPSLPLHLGTTQCDNAIRASRASRASCGHVHVVLLFHLLHA